MKKQFTILAALFFLTMSFTSCTTWNKTMREPNVRVELNKDDFTLSDQVSANAKTTKVLGIDWSRLFKQRTGNIEGGSAGISLASIPVIGNAVSDKTANYALYNLMNENGGYDVIFYPQYETKVFRPVLGIGSIYKVTEVKTTARLGKLNK